MQEPDTDETAEVAQEECLKADENGAIVLTASQDELVTRFLDAEGRERKKLLKEILSFADREVAIRIAKVIRDPSPRVAARVTSLLARNDLNDLFESLLIGLKPGKVSLLRAHYKKIRSGKKEG